MTENWAVMSLLDQIQQRPHISGTGCALVCMVCTLCAHGNLCTLKEVILKSVSECPQTVCTFFVRVLKKCAHNILGLFSVHRPFWPVSMLCTPVYQEYSIFSTANKFCIKYAQFFAVKRPPNFGSERRVPGLGGGEKKDVSDYRAFGCSAWVYLDKQHREKGKQTPRAMGVHERVGILGPGRLENNVMMLFM